MNSGVFLDRDGVINEVLSKRVKFVNSPEDFYLLPRVGEAIKMFNERKLPVFVVTNQGGVGLGFMSEKALHNVHKEMKKQLAKFGAHVIEVSYCAHKPHEGCECRKPGAKMLVDLAEKYNITLEESYMIGDRDVDILAGKAAGTKTILIGKDPSVQADHQFPSLWEAATYIVETI
ncbi:HAD family hydrolase [Bacillus sp. BGMRC 2118]|nr:HAD family hydrolase [Bacillus sp. BGMRC 2118]